MGIPAFRIGLKGWCASDVAEKHPDEAKLPAPLRRRVTPLGRRTLAAALALQPGADTRFIFSSRHGEYSRTASMLRSLAELGSVSPADFSLSVHHALAGLLSIATGSRKGHTALAAGDDTFGYGLIEASMCLAENPDEPVLVVHYDEPLPEIYSELEPQSVPASVVAMLLGAAQGQDDIEIEAIPPAPGASVSALSAEFAAFLRSNEREGSAKGERFTWVWRRA